MYQYQTKQDLCPQCGALLNGATALDGERSPEPDDVTLCVYCATFLKYDKELFLRLLPEQEFETLPEDTQTLLANARDIAQRMKIKAKGKLLGV